MLLFLRQNPKGGRRGWFWEEGPAVEVLYCQTYLETCTTFGSDGAARLLEGVS
jgi:hypothetical protein